MNNHKDPYAVVITWITEDIQELCPEWTLEQCQDFLDSYGHRLEDRSIELGFEVLDCLIQESKQNK